MLVRTGAGQEFLIASVHRPTMRPGFESLRDHDFRELERAIDARRRAMSELVTDLEGTRGIPTILAGDFNTPADSSLFDPLREQFHIGFERAGWGYGYTWPARLPGIRIDHVLASPEWSFTGCWVGPDLGSDHRPVIAEVVRRPAR